jgi:hypothetical protein
VISWVALVIGGLTLLLILRPTSSEGQRHVAEYRSQHPFLYARLCAGPIVALISGLFILRGFNWARWLFVLWFGYNLMENIAHVSRKPPLFPALAAVPTLSAGLFFGAGAYLLFRPSARTFFRGHASLGAQVSPENNPTSGIGISAEAACAECRALSTSRI